MNETTARSGLPGLAVERLELLLRLALDLNASLTREDRYSRLIAAVRSAIACDATALFEVDERRGELLPLASFGLHESLRAQRFKIHEHPRLEVVCAGLSPTCFPPDCELPDPFDGWLANDVLGQDHVHACFGCPLRIDGRLVGVLTADAKDPKAFQELDGVFLETLGALAAASLRTAQLLDSLELAAKRSGSIADDLLRERRRSLRELLGESAPMQRLRQEIALVANTNFAVLILGETGTGKELIAHALHESSGRAGAAFISVNCAALPEQLAESELFGHLRGAYTGAGEERAGKFEVADGGTLFLDEVGELPLRIQALLLRALQSGEVQRLGSDRLHQVDVRIIAATNRDLDAEVKSGRFRADLLHRLSVYRLKAPALRERPDDIALLAGAMADRQRRNLGLGPVRFSADAIEALRRADWPGNVRELENLVARALLHAGRRAPRGLEVPIQSADLSLDPNLNLVSTQPPQALPVPAKTGTLREQVEDFKRQLVLEALDRNQGSYARAAVDLGMERGNLFKLVQRLRSENP
jgi:anaerobic nitric oxide reductase transcription regulator